MSEDFPTASRSPRIAFAGDRAIAVRCLRLLLDAGVFPEALLISPPDRASHANELRQACSHLDDERVLVGPEFRSTRGANLLAGLGLDYLIGVHFPFLVPASILQLPRIGVLNLHPAFLPYNRGWHTATWALLEGTPFGATLHFMDEGLDTGDIVHQRLLTPHLADTAHTLYSKVAAVEFNVFKEAWPALATLDPPRTPQTGHSSTHSKADLTKSGVRRLDLDSDPNTSEVLRKLRALTTNRIEEAAYVEADGKTYLFQLRVEEAGPIQQG